jgi:hypothetical protein
MEPERNMLSEICQSEKDRLAHVLSHVASTCEKKKTRV